jgi:hypothetical protein
MDFRKIRSPGMKATILLLAILLSALSFAQSPSRILRFANATKVFGEKLPAGAILIDVGTGKTYLTLRPLASAKTIATCSGTELREMSNITHSGDVTGTEALTIANDAITNAKMADDAVNTGELTNNAVTYGKIQQVAAASLIGNPTGSLADPVGITLGSGLSFSSGTLTATGTGGTVTSVGLSLPTIFTVSNSPVTSAGTLTGTLANQTANTFFAAPDGSVGSPAFRAIVPADVPTLNQNTTGNATTATNLKGGTAGAVPYQVATDQTGFTAAGTAGQILTSTGTTAPVWSSGVTVSGDVTFAETGVATVTQIQGKPVSATAPTNSQILVFNGSTWTPTNHAVATTMTGSLPVVVTGGDISIQPATAVAAGSMSAADKAKLDGLPNSSVQALSGTTVSWNVANGLNATITLTGATTITLSNVVAGTSGNLSVSNAATAYSLGFAGYTNKISPVVFSAANTVTTSGATRTDLFSWYYDGSTLFWNGSLDYQ